MRVMQIMAFFAILLFVVSMASCGLTVAKQSTIDDLRSDIIATRAQLNACETGAEYRKVEEKLQMLIYEYNSLVESGKKK